MERSAARARLERMVANTEAPALESDEIELLLDDAQRPDVDGLLPDDDGWNGTYDLNAAAAAGFRLKAAKVAGRDPFSADGATFDRGKAAERLLKMASSHEDLAAGLDPGGATDTGDSQILGPHTGLYADEDPVPWVFNL